MVGKQGWCVLASHDVFCPGCKKRSAHIHEMVFAIDVGGYVYETTVETLSKSPTLLVELEHRRTHSITDMIFVDRDGLCFSHILNYLRTGFIWASNGQHTQILRIEAEYYKLEGAITQLDAQFREFSE